MATAFNRGISDKFIEKLAFEADKGGWWADVLADPGLVIAVRCDYLDIYWRGQRLFHVSPSSSGVSVKTHIKYLVDPKLADEVKLIDDSFAVIELVKRAFVERYEGSSTLAKMKKAAGIFSGPEKTGCHTIAIQTPSLVDAEIAFPGTISLNDGGKDKNNPRVDLAMFKADDDDVHLVFWEAKHFGNGELRTAGDQPAVCRQVRIYHKYLIDNRTALETSYRRVAKNLVALRSMGSARPLSPLIEQVAHEPSRLTLGPDPKVGLLIFGFDTAQRDHSDWGLHLARLRKDINPVQAKGKAESIRF